MVLVLLILLVQRCVDRSTPEIVGVVSHVWGIEVVDTEVSSQIFWWKKKKKKNWMKNWSSKWDQTWRCTIHLDGKDPIHPIPKDTRRDKNGDVRVSERAFDCA